ncbi:MAG: 3-phosphoshikimate 1-carboxyvinyltransferase [Bacteroidales bacterium]|nr:3-phosphoshikimate 1-carboxyvinyltransferase [Bacteroidales bacterium]
MNYAIFPPEGYLEATIELPLSKSMSNRALIINALTPGSEPLIDVARCDDTDAVVAALQVDPKGYPTVNIGAAGTAMRFLTAYFAATEGAEVVLDGSERMRKRPIGQLVEMLRGVGAEVEYAGEEGFPPLRITGRKLQGGEVTISETVSSQYISAMLMIAPTMEQGLRLCVEGDLPSLPYIKMTLGMMEQRGADYERGPELITVRPGTYDDTPLKVEQDWSAASYWYEIAALSGGEVTLPGISIPSLQGDAQCEKFFERLGVFTQEAEEGPGYTLSASPDMYSRLELDLVDQPDLAQTLAVTAATIGVPFHLTGLKSLRVKETDRLEALRRELLKIGVMVEIEGDNAISWEGKRVPVTEMPRIATYDDHRMAMSFAPVAIFCPGMVIENAEVVSKSYPGYWEALQSAGFQLIDIDAAQTETQEEAME